MTKQTPDEQTPPARPTLPPDSILAPRPLAEPKEGDFRYAPPITAEQTKSVFERIAQQDREHREKEHAIDKAWHSKEAKKIHEVIREDGNVDWRQFVTHCGGILNVVAMVDEFGLPDTDQIIPKVDELFSKDSETEYQGGVIFRRHPRNRPYVAGRGTSQGEALWAQKRAEFPGDNEPGSRDPEALLRAEEERRAKPRATYPR